uniref:VOC domain-containing protein n=1 Tax=Araucaria cunninghamii TaxID=56994 RepID=A0A0D6R8X4_ARACU
MAIAAVASFSVIAPLRENHKIHKSYPRQAFLNNKFPSSRPKLVERQQPGQSPCLQLSVTKASTTRDVLVDEQSANNAKNIGVISVHHVGLLCSNLEKSLEFYQGLLGLEVNEARPNDKLPYRGKWLWVGSEMIHLMELPNPDPLTGRPQHGGRDRHTCIAIKNVNVLKSIFDKAGVPYTLSRSGRPAIFARDPDSNALEFVQLE